MKIYREDGKSEEKSIYGDGNGDVGENVEKPEESTDKDWICKDELERPENGVKSKS